MRAIFRKEGKKERKKRGKAEKPSSAYSMVQGDWEKDHSNTERNVFQGMFHGTVATPNYCLITVFPIVVNT